jgi:hypothetical protein
MKIIITTFTCILFSLSLLAQTGQEVKKQNDDDELASRICNASYLAFGGAEPAKFLNAAILSQLGVDLNHPNRSQIISDFFNENHDNLICNGMSHKKHREYEHIFKRAIAHKEYGFLYHYAGNEEYSINFNTYEIVDGKKETLLDYVDMILSDPVKRDEYNIDELKMVRLTLVEIGVLKGEEL